MRITYLLHTHCHTYCLQRDQCGVTTRNISYAWTLICLFLTAGRRPRTTSSPERPASTQTGSRPVFLDALKDLETAEGRDVDLKVKVAGKCRVMLGLRERRQQDVMASARWRDCSEESCDGDVGVMWEWE